MTYDELLKSIVDLQTWLEKRSPNGRIMGRLATYIRDIKILNDPKKRVNLRHHFKTKEAMRELFFTLQETHELQMIFNELKKDHEWLLNKRLLTTISGPTRSQDERSSNSGNAPRNFQFELYLSAQLVKAGFEIFETEAADVWSSYQGRNVMIECKRPQGSTKIKSAISDAVEQLNNRALAENGPAVRIIALSLTKILTKGKLLFSPMDESLASRILSEFINSEIEPFIPYYLEKAGTTVGGLLISANASAIKSNAAGISSIDMVHFFDNKNSDNETKLFVESWFNHFTRLRTI